MTRHSLAALLCCAACTHAPAVPSTSTEAAPITGGFDLASIDRKADPCDDFFQFACGGWLEKNEIPADKPRWGRFDELAEKNRTRLREMLDADAAGKGAAEDPDTQKLGDFWTSCMDEAAVEASGPAALEAELKKIDAVKDTASLEKIVATFHRNAIHPLFAFGSTQDFKDATQVIGDLDQAGLGLPDRDYYLKTDPKSADIQKIYLAHVETMFTLAGEQPADAAAHAKLVYDLEKSMAEASQTKVERRDPKNVYHRLDFDGLTKAAPHFDWAQYLADVGRADIKAINVDAPKFVETISALVKSTPMATWRAYLRWHLIHGVVGALPKKFVDENFHFMSTALTGAKELEARWKRCVRGTDGALGYSLAQSYVRQTFGTDGKARSQELIAGIEAAFKSDVDTLPWMDDATKKQALGKLAKIVNKVGYPDKWRNYEGLAIDRQSYLRNALAASAFEVQRDLNKIGKPLDRTEWDMTPPTVNAYYNPSMNEMVFPAGILQPPFFNRAASYDVNFGAIGVVMGHELTHGFDDEGRQFDGDGNLRDWWSETSGKEFDARSACVAKQFDTYVAVEDVHVNGKLTLGENLADLGGVKLAITAARDHRAGREVPVAEGFTADQQVFLGFAQVWCNKARDPFARMMASVDPHSPARFRVIGPLSNTAEFAEAFHCPAGAKMVRPPEERCKVW